MSRQRDLVQEIIEKRERNKSRPAQGELYIRLHALERAFDNRPTTNEELIKYFPIALVACIENYFRITIKEIIDFDDRYLNSASKLVEKVKFDYDIVRAFQGKKISLGEFISHLVPINNLSTLDSAMSTLLGFNYLEKVSFVHDRLAHEVHGDEKKPIIPDKDYCFKFVSRTFELRHIFCHEMANRQKIDSKEIEECFTSTLTFIKAADELHHQTLYPNAPLSQFEMNKQAFESLGRATRHLEGLNKTVESFLPKDRFEEYVAAHKNWEKFRDSYAEFHANEYKGGSLWKTIYGETAAEITQKRIMEIEGYIEILKEFGGERP